MNIGFDIDGVLNDFEQFVKEKGRFYLQKEPVNPRGEDISEIFEVPQGIEDAFWKEMILDYSTEHPARPNIDRVIRKLKKEGHRIFIITNRCKDLSYCDISFEEMTGYIQNWLQEYHIEYDQLIFNRIKSKLPICLEHHIEVMVEDSPYQIKELSPFLRVICFEASYNSENDIENLVYVNCANELYDAIVQINT